jgi:hypothetical protein
MAFDELPPLAFLEMEAEDRKIDHLAALSTGNEIYFIGFNCRWSHLKLA